MDVPNIDPNILDYHPEGLPTEVGETPKEAPMHLHLQQTSPNLATSPSPPHIRIYTSVVRLELQENSHIRQELNAIRAELQDRDGASVRA